MKSFNAESDAHDLSFYKAIVDHLPAHILINEVSQLNDKQFHVNLWANDRGLEFVGYSQEEILETGKEFFSKVVHPDDIHVLRKTISGIHRDPKKSCGGFVRVKPGKGDYQWMVWCLSVMESDHEHSMKILAVNLNVSEMVDSEHQMSLLLKENLRLKNQLRICSLTRRETEVLKLISQGLGDKEISGRLHISATTAKTHRHNLHRKLQLKNTASLVHFAMETGLS